MCPDEMLLTDCRDETGRRPQTVPVTDAEITVFEAWFGDLFDELSGTVRPSGFPVPIP